MVRTTMDQATRRMLYDHAEGLFRAPATCCAWWTRDDWANYVNTYFLDCIDVETLRVRNIQVRIV